MNEGNIRDKVVVITGASSGFGKGTALALAKRGARLVLAARRRGLLDELAAECRGSGTHASAVQTDVSSADEMRALAATGIREMGHIDVWINNAGVGAVGPFERVPLADHVQVVETNLLGTLYGSYYAYQHFLERDRGTLINIASELGHYTVPYYSTYAAAKHGVVGLNDALRQEVKLAGRRDIHICTVMPTAHDTPFFDHAANYTGHERQAPKPLHDPMDVVEALVALVVDPEDKRIVGGDGIVKVLFKNLLPPLADRMAAKQMHKTLMVEPPLAADSPGAVRQPMPQGTEVSGGRLTRH